MDFPENQNQTDSAATEIVPPTELNVAPRKIVPRIVFWPVFILLLLGIAGSTLAYLDRKVWHQNFDEILPTSTSFLLILPNPESNREYGRAMELYNRLPSNSQVLNFNIEAAAASDPEISNIYTFWNNFKSVLGPEVVFAKTPAGFVITFEPTGKIPESLGEAYLGQNIFKKDGNFYLWQTNGRIFAAENPDVLKQIISIQYHSQITRSEYWLSKNTRAKGLNTVKLYQESFGHLVRPFLAGVYLNSELGGADQINKAAGQALTFPKVLSVLFTEAKFGGVKTLALGLNASDRGLGLRAVEVSENYSSSSQELLPVPDKINGSPVDAYWQANDLGNYKELIKTLDSEYGTNFDLENFSGRVAIFGNLEKGALGLLAENPNLSELERFASDILGIAKLLLPDAKYEISGRFLAISNNPQSVQEILSKALAPSGSSGAKFDSNFYIYTPSLVKILENLTASFATSDVFEAWGILAKALPVFTASSAKIGSTSITDWFLRVDELSAKDKVNAEKVFNRLAGRNNETLELSEVKDATRRADVAILQNAIAEFSVKNKRAPDNLQELVPIYTAQIPLDPATNEPYTFKNTGANLSFYLMVTYDEGGTYCLTSNGVKLMDKACKEE